MDEREVDQAVSLLLTIRAHIREYARFTGQTLHDAFSDVTMFTGSTMTPEQMREYLLEKGGDDDAI